TRETVEQGMDLRFGIRAALVPLGEERQAIQHLREAEATAEALGDHSRLGRVSIYLSHYYWWVGDYSHALESGQRALQSPAGIVTSRWRLSRIIILVWPITWWAIIGARSIRSRGTSRLSKVT